MYLCPINIANFRYVSRKWNELIIRHKHLKLREHGRKLVIFGDGIYGITFENGIRRHYDFPLDHWRPERVYIDEIDWISNNESCPKNLRGAKMNVLKLNIFLEKGKT